MRVHENAAGKSWVLPEDLENGFVALEKAKGLTKFAYEEERVEEILRRVIDKNKAILVELIKQENALKAEEQKAILAVQKINKELTDVERNYPRRRELPIDPIRNVLHQVNEIIGLLEKDAQIEQALSVVASDLASLISILPKSDE